MTRKISLKLTGSAEKFIDDLEQKGLSEREIVSRALWLLEVAVKSNKIALLNDNGDAEYIFTLRTLSDSLASGEGIKKEHPEAMEAKFSAEEGQVSEERPASYMREKMAAKIEAAEKAQRRRYEEGFKVDDLSGFSQEATVEDEVAKEVKKMWEMVLGDSEGFKSRSDRARDAAIEALRKAAKEAAQEKEE